VLLIVNLLVFKAMSHPVHITALDSLQTILTTAKQDTDKVKVWLEISNRAACKDTVYSLNTAKSALLLAEKAGWERGQVLALKRIGDIYFFCINDYQRSFIYCSRSSAIAKSIADSFDLAVAYNTIGAIYENAQKYDSSLTYYRKSLELNKDPDRQTNLLGNSGNVYNDLGDFLHALDCYEQALKINEELLSKNNKNKADSLTRLGLLLTIGDIYVSMSQYNNALENYQSALKITEILKRKDLKIWALTKIGTLYNIRKDFANAMQYYVKSLAISDSLDGHYRRSNILNAIANVGIATGDYAKALQYADEARDIVEKKNDLQLLPKVYTTLGIVYTKIHDYPKSVAYYLKAIEICETTKAIADEKDTWEALSNTYVLMHQTDKAFAAYRHFITLRDSVYNVDKVKELTRIEMEEAYGRKQVQDSLVQAKKDVAVQLHIQRQRWAIYGGFAGLALVLLLSFVIYRNYAQERKAVTAITKANKTISEQKQVSETLLLNILPADVADELKARGKVKAKLYDNVSVLFTDFVNFTIASERMSPEELIEELHTCFEAFDNIVGKYKIEKIKTVGDAYVAVSGLPNANPSHAADMIRAAIEIRDFITTRKKEIGDNTFGIRIGINSGKLVAGIVGVKKFAYDIWGDTVNTAARMEQTGMEGKINISSTTYQLVKDEIACTYRGEIDAKNKGKLKMYFVD